MSQSGVTWPEIWYGESTVARLLRGVLTPASWLYGAGWSIYRGLYDLGLKRAQAPYAPVLVVGNLTVGGSGKTPLTALVASELTSMGREVVVGVSGYGSPRAEGATFAPDGPLDPKTWGDEAALFRELLPSIPLIVGRARVRAAELMAKRYGEAVPRPVLVMDDGFQHLPLAPSASILLDPPSANRRLLPAGPYREPRSSLKRADVVIGPASSEFTVRSQIAGFERLEAPGLRVPIDPGVVSALCAIGRPEVFFSDLEAFGVRLGTRHTLPDHSDFSDLDWDKFGYPLVVTAKDAVKLRQRPDLAGRAIFVARQEISVEPPDGFRDRLLSLIDL